MKLDLDFKEEKIGALNKELEELQVGGGASEEEVSALKRQKHDLDMRLKDQVMAFTFRYGICSLGIGKIRICLHYKTWKTEQLFN